jgi:hypothetical protein
MCGPCGHTRAPRFPLKFEDALIDTAPIDWNLRELRSRTWHLQPDAYASMTGLHQEFHHGE